METAHLTDMIWLMTLTILSDDLTILGMNFGASLLHITRVKIGNIKYTVKENQKPSKSHLLGPDSEE